MKFTENKNGGIKENYAENKNLSHNSYRGNKKWDTLESDAARIDRTGKFERTYKNKDGSFTALFENVPSQYQSSDGRFDKIDNSLVSEESDEGVVFRNKVNAFTARFPEKMSDKTFSIERGIYKACFSVVDSHNDTIPAKMRSSLKGCYKNNPGKLAAIDDSDKSKIVYTSFCKGGDLEYSVFNDRVKENIIVHEKRAQYKFAFIMDLEELTPKMNDDGTISLFSADNETASESEVIFTIPTPVMFDGDGNYSELVKYDIKTISEEENKYLFVAVAESEWINAEDRRFPVTIDPQVVLNQIENNATLINVCRCLCDCCGNNSPIYTSGSYELSDNSVEKRYIQVEIKNPTKYSRAFDKNIRAMRASLIWDISGGSGCNGHFVIKSGERVIEHFVYDGQPDIRVDVTNFLNEMIKDGSDSFTLTFEVSADCDCTHALYLSNAASALRLLVDYIPNSIVEANSETYSFNVKQAGNGNINLATENVVFEHTNVTTSSEIMPISVSHIYDGENAKNEFDTVYCSGRAEKISPNYQLGKGWKLNIQQTLAVPGRNIDYRSDSFLSDSDKVYYVNAKGKKIAFEKKFFYLKDGVKYFVKESDCKKIAREYVIDENGYYKIDVLGTEYDVHKVYMSDNSMYLYLDQEKAMYLDEREYEKYYEYKGEKYSVTLTDGRNFDYDAYYIEWNGIRHEIDSSYVERVEEDGNVKYYVTLDMRDYDGRTVRTEAFPKTYRKYLSQDSAGEYFYINTARMCCSQSSYTSLEKVRVDVFSVDFFTQDSVSLSNASFSKELINVDSALSEINQVISDLEASHESYIEQQIALRGNQRTTEQLAAARSELYKIQGELMTASEELAIKQYELAVKTNSYQIEANDKQLAELEAFRDMNEEKQPKSKYYYTFQGNKDTVEKQLNLGKEQSALSLETAEIQKRSSQDQARMNVIQQWMSDLEYAEAIENIEEQINALWDARSKVREQLRVYKELRSKKLTEKAILIRKEKNMPCDYIYDEFNNTLVFDYYGRLMAIQSNNNVVTFTYDDDNKITHITTSDNDTICLAYNSSERLESITDTDGRVTRYVYCESDPTRLEKILLPEYDEEHPWAVIQFGYDSSGRLDSITDQSGYMVTLGYGANSITLTEHTRTERIEDGNISEADSIIDGDSVKVEFRSPFLTAVTAGGKTTVYQMDITGRVTASYEEKSNTNGKLIDVSNTTAVEYNGKYRTYSVRTDGTCENLIKYGSDFTALNKWTIEGGCSMDGLYGTDGNGALRLYGNPDGIRRVSQRIDGADLRSSKTHYLLSLWAKATSAQIQTERNTGYEDQYLETHTNTELFDENAPRKFGIKAVATYADGTTDTFYSSFDWYNTDWQLCQLPIRLKSEAMYIDISFEYNYNLGTVHIDNFRLTDEYGTERRYSEDGKCIWSSDGVTESWYRYNGGIYPIEVLEVDAADAVKYNCTQNCLECMGRNECKHAINKYGYNSRGMLLWSEDHSGIITKNTYNKDGQLTATYTYHEGDPTSKFCTENTYDDYGRLATSTDPRGKVNGETLKSIYEYNVDNNLLKAVTSAGGITTEYGYNHLTDTQVSISVDNNGVEHTNRNNYTAGYLTRLDNMSGIWYNYTYDGFGRLKEVKINGETAVTFAEPPKDDDGVRTLIRTLADGTEYTVTCDAQGRTVEVKLGSEIIKNEFSYDDAGRCTGYIEFPSGTNKKRHRFTYKDTETSHVSGDVTVTSLNNEKGKTTSTTYRFSESDAHVYNFVYDNDFDEKLRSITHGNVIQTLSYDKLGRQTESKIEGIYSKKATYLKYGDHTTDIIADLTYKITNGNTDREKYSYDKEGNICAIHENGKLKVRYTYDALNRLIREDNKELELTTTFEYDNGGNLLRQNEYAYSLAPTDELTDGNEIVYTYAESRSDMLTDFNSEAITYDANGCPETYRDNNCEYTRGTLLSKYGSNTFEYDADGIRTKKNGITFTYVDGKLIRQTGGSGTIDFIYGAGGAIGFKFAGNTYIYRRNLMGDVTHIYTTDGTLVARYVYDAWGNHKIYDVNGGEVTKSMSAHIGNINPIRYRGYYYDDYENENGLYYLEARYYDPETGRFISQDSIDFLVPNHLTGLNLYAYCNNNPVMYSDPSGNSIILGTLAVLGISALVGAVTGAAFNAASYAITTSEEDFSWKGLAASALGGAVSGGITGLAGGITLLTGGSAGVMLGVSIGAGVAAGAFGQLTENAVNGYKGADLLKDVGSSAVWGGVFGAIFGATQSASWGVKKLAEMKGRTMSKQIMSVLKYKVVKKAGSKSLENILSDFTSWYSEKCIGQYYNNIRAMA